jgi:hypothetical protein
MTRPRELVRRWLGVEETAAAAPPPDEAVRRLDALTRQVAELRGLLSQQSAVLMEALQRAGWQDREDVAQQEALERALSAARSGGDVIAGPWTGEVGFELLYWIPFLAWLIEQGLDPSRLIVVSRGGAGGWYRHLTARYVDVLDLMTPAEFRSRTAGKKKQYDARRELDAELLDAVRTKLSAPSAAAVHPAAMFRLFAALWRRRSTAGLVESFTAFRRLTPPIGDGAPVAGLPDQYVAAKFYFSKAFPDNGTNRRFVRDVLSRVSRRSPVVLMRAGVALDEHDDFDGAGASGVFVVDTHAVPQRNLEAATRIVAGARGFIGTYGGFSYLAPFQGVRSVSFFSRRFGFEPHHLELADRVFDRLLPGGFIALHRDAVDLVEPAIDRWTGAAAGTARSAPDPEEESVGT